MFDELLQGVNACRCPCTQNTKCYVHITHVDFFFFYPVVELLLLRGKCVCLLSLSAGDLFFVYFPVYFPGALGIKGSVGTNSGAIVTE